MRFAREPHGLVYQKDSFGRWTSHESRTDRDRRNQPRLRPAAAASWIASARLQARDVPGPARARSAFTFDSV